MTTVQHFFNLEGMNHRELFLKDGDVWMVLNDLEDYLVSYFIDSWPLKGISGQITAPIVICDDDIIDDAEIKPVEFKGKVRAYSNGKLIEGATIIMPGAYLFDDHIAVGSGTVVEPGALIKGPTIIGNDSEIRQGAYIRGRCLVGDGCVVGHATEMKAAIMLDGAQAGHFAYIGDSILGKDVNLGAGTKLANLKVIPGNVIVASGKNRLDTGRRKLGAILGDHAETGCNSVTSPGVLLSPRSIVYPGVSVPPGYYPTRTTFMPPRDSPRIRSAK